MNDNTLISVQNVKKYYNGEKVKALDGVSADIKRGEVVVVMLLYVLNADEGVIFHPVSASFQNALTAM